MKLKSFVWYVLGAVSMLFNVFKPSIEAAWDINKILSSPLETGIKSVKRSFSFAYFILCKLITKIIRSQKYTGLLTSEPAYILKSTLQSRASPARVDKNAIFSGFLSENHFQ